MSFTKALKTFLAIALSVFLGFNSFFTQDALAQSTFSTQTEKQEFKQLIDPVTELMTSELSFKSF